MFIKVSSGPECAAARAAAALAFVALAACAPAHPAPPGAATTGTNSPPVPPVLHGIDAAFEEPPDVRSGRVSLGPPDPAPLDVPPGLPEARARFAPPGTLRVDGALDDWPADGWIALDRSAQWATNEKGAWNGPDDLSARVAFAFDERFLYIAADVRDDAPGRVHAGGSLWRGDSVQVALDPFLQRSKDVPGPFDFEFGYSLPLPPASPDFHVWQSPALSAPPTGALTAAWSEGGRATAEAAVPLDGLAPLAPALSGVCGMSVLVNDADGDHRKGFLEWTPGIGARKDPSSFGLLRFDEPPVESRPPLAAAVAWTRTVAPLGTPLEADVFLAAERETEAMLRLSVLDDGVLRAADSLSIPVPAGRHRRRLRLNTAELPPGRFRIDTEILAGKLAVARQSMLAGIYPPAEWER
jgi:hypothetical protein